MSVLVQQRHLEFIAGVLLECRPDDISVNTPAVHQWRATVEHFRKACSRCNPKFKEHLFLKACGV